MASSDSVSTWASDENDDRLFFATCNAGGSCAVAQQLSGLAALSPV